MQETATTSPIPVTTLTTSSPTSPPATASVIPAKALKFRRRIVASDSEDDEEAEDAPLAATLNNKHKVAAIVSDDDDEGNDGENSMDTREEVDCGDLEARLAEDRKQRLLQLVKKRGKIAAMKSKDNKKSSNNITSSSSRRNNDYTSTTMEKDIEDEEGKVKITTLATSSSLSSTPSSSKQLPKLDASIYGSPIGNNDEMDSLPSDIEEELNIDLVVSSVVVASGRVAPKLLNKSQSSPPHSKLSSSSDTDESDQEARNLKESVTESNFYGFNKKKSSPVAASGSDDSDVEVASKSKMRDMKKKRVASKKALFEIEKETQRLLRQSHVKLETKESSFTMDDFMAKFGIKREAPSSIWLQGDDEDDDEEDGTYGEDGGDEQQPAQPLATDTLLEKDGGDIMEVSCNGQSEVALFASLASDRIALTAFGAGVQQPPQSSFDRMDLSESNENHAAESKTIVSQEEEVAPAPSSPTVPKLVVDKVVTNQQAKKLFEQSRIFIQKKVASLGNDLGDENGDDDNDSDGLEIIEIQDHQSKTTAHEHAVKSIYASKSKQPAPGVLISELRRKQLKLAEEQLKQAKIKQEIIAEQKRKEKAEAEAAKKQLREAIMAKRRLQREEEKKRKQEEMEKKRQEQEEASSGTATAEHVVSNATTPVDMVQEKPITSEAKDVPPTVGQPPPTTEEGNVEDIDVDADYIDPKAASKWDEDEMFTDSQFIPSGPVSMELGETQDSIEDLDQEMFIPSLPFSQFSQEMVSTQSETAEKPVIMPPPISHPPKKGTLAYFFNKPDSASKDTIVLETPPGALNFTTNHNADIVPSGDPSIISSNPTMTPMQGNMLLSQSLFLHRERDDDIEDELDGLLSGKPANSIGNINLGINLAMNSTIKSSSCSTIDSSVVVVATASLTIMEESKEEYEEHDDEPSASIADVIPKGVKIRRGKAILFDESDDDDEDEEGAGGGDDDEEGVEGTNSLRFGEIKASHPFQKPSSDAFAGLASLIGPNPTAPPKKSAYIEEEAEEEDDEFKGLGGIDGEDLGGIDLDKDDPNLVVKDEDMGDPLEGMDDVVALHLKQMHDQDKLDIDALLNDVTSGALRKKGFGVALRANRYEGAAGKGFELEDSDDDEAMIRRLKTRYAKYHRPTQQEDEDKTALEKYASHPDTAAFAKSLVVDLNTQGFLSSDSSSESEEDEQSSNPSKNASKEDEEAVTSRSSFYKIKSVLVRTKNSMGRRADEEIEDDMIATDENIVMPFDQTKSISSSSTTTIGKRKRTIIVTSNTQKSASLAKIDCDKKGLNSIRSDEPILRLASTPSSKTTSSIFMKNSRSPKTLERLRAAGLIGKQDTDSGTRAKKGGFTFSHKK